MTRNAAVTEEAPAASSAPNFLPTDEKYRLTGEMPADTDEAPAASSTETGKQDEQHAETGGASAASESDTAAASEAALSQREEPRQKTQASSESRWAKISRENRELREKLARAEGRQEARAEGSQSAQQRDTQQASQSAAGAKTSTSANPKPKIDDIDPQTHQPKYKTFADYEEAKDAWNRQEAIREFTESSQKSDQARQQTEAEKIIERTVNERVAEVRKLHSDYNDVITTALAQKDEHGQEIFFYTKGSPLDGFFLDSERGHEVMYEIGKNFEQHAHIFARDAQGKYLLNPVRQLRELSKIENSLPEAGASSGTSQGAGKSSSSSARPITQAARPPHQVSGTGTVAKDAVEQAIEDGDFESYQRAQNAKVLARLKRK